MLALLSLVLAAQGTAADVVPAESLFRRGRELSRQGLAEQACPLFEKSFALEPSLGTLLNIADCHEAMGHRVQAFLRFNQAAGWAHRIHESRREAMAHARAQALKDRLSWLTLSCASPAPGLVVRVGDFDVPLGAAAEEVPVDPGRVPVTATAPGFHAWTTEVQVAPSSTAELAVPPLASKLASLAKAEPALVSPPLVVIERVPAPPAAEARPIAAASAALESYQAARLRALVVGGVGALGLAAGAALGIGGQVSYDRFHSAATLAQKAAAQSQTSALSVSADTAFGVGLAAGATAVLLYPRGPAPKVSLVPTPQGAALTGAF